MNFKHIRVKAFALLLCIAVSVTPVSRASEQSHFVEDIAIGVSHIALNFACYDIHQLLRKNSSFWERLSVTLASNYLLGHFWGDTLLSEERAYTRMVACLVTGLGLLWITEAKQQEAATEKHELRKELRKKYEERELEMRAHHEEVNQAWLDLFTQCFAGEPENEQPIVTSQEVIAEQA